MPKICIDCHEQIHDEAIRCSHCGSYQSFQRRIIGSSAVILALVVALISVSTAAVWAIRAIQSQGGPFIMASVTEYSGDGVHVTFRNIGLEAGYVYLAEISVTRPDNSEPIYIAFNEPDDGGLLRVRPGEQETVVHRDPFVSAFSDADIESVREASELGIGRENGNQIYINVYYRDRDGRTLESSSELDDYRAVVFVRSELRRFLSN